MNVKSRFVDRVAFFELDGALTVEASAERLHREMEELPSGVVNRVVLDLGRVSMLDAAAVGQLVVLYLKAKSRGFGFEVVNASPLQRELLGLVRLREVFGVEEAAGELPRSEREQPRSPVGSRRRARFGGRWLPGTLTG